MSDSWWSWPGNVTLILGRAPHKSSVTSLPKSPQKSLSWECPLWAHWSVHEPHKRMMGWLGWSSFGHKSATTAKIPVDATCEVHITMMTTSKWSSAHAESSCFIFWTDTRNHHLVESIPKNEPTFFLPELPASRIRASNMLIEIQVSGLIKNHHTSRSHTVYIVFTKQYCYILL